MLHLENYEHFPIVVDSELNSDFQKKILQAFIDINIEMQKDLLQRIDENIIGFKESNINEYKKYLE